MADGIADQDGSILGLNPSCIRSIEAPVLDEKPRDSRLEPDSEARPSSETAREQSRVNKYKRAAASNADPWLDASSKKCGDGHRKTGGAAPWQKDSETTPSKGAHVP